MAKLPSLSQESISCLFTESLQGCKVREKSLICSSPQNILPSSCVSEINHINLIVNNILLLLVATINQKKKLNHYITHIPFFFSFSC